MYIERPQIGLRLLLLPQSKGPLAVWLPKHLRRFAHPPIPPLNVTTPDTPPLALSSATFHSRPKTVSSSSYNMYLSWRVSGLLHNITHVHHHHPLQQWCTTSGPRATSGPRRVLVWPAVSNKKSDYFKPRHSFGLQWRNLNFTKTST